jgi:hypothetical protein
MIWMDNKLIQMRESDLLVRAFCDPLWGLGFEVVSIGLLSHYCFIIHDNKQFHFVKNK